jgi:hypothetical protein
VKLESQSHPIGILSRIADVGGRPLSFEFSRYRYEPRAIPDERKSFRVDYEDVSAWIDSMMETLEGEEDLAFHSRVYLKNERIRHIPMIDFVGKPSENSLRRVEDVLKEFQIHDYEIFDSGRSLHLYGLALITFEEWLRFLGRILLVNLPSEKEVVDSRWVGHRLMAGYGTLRWTKNNKQYQAWPTKVRRQGQ